MTTFCWRGLLRRAAGIHCPCSRAALRAALTESLAYLQPDLGALAGRLDDLIEAMIVAGDLLELSDVATDDPDVKGTWVFAAPPSFVVRRTGSIFLTGIAPDQDGFLPEHLARRVIRSHVTQFIAPEPGEDLIEQLIAHGLHQLSEAVWLRSPKVQTPEQLIRRFENQLASQPTCGPVSGLEILDRDTKVTYYRGRWSAPRGQTGTFVARRPQEFGAPLWSFAELVDGTLKRIVDLPPKHFRWARMRCRVALTNGDRPHCGTATAIPAQIHRFRCPFRFLFTAATLGAAPIDASRSRTSTQQQRVRVRGPRDRGGRRREKPSGKLVAGADGRVSIWEWNKYADN